MDYDQTKAKWLKCVMEVCLQWGAAMISQHVAAMGGGQKKAGGASASGSASSSGGGNNGGQQHGRGTGGNTGSGDGSNTGSKRLGFNKSEWFQGLKVCYGFNSAAGCWWLPAGMTAATCMDGKTHFAHRRNYFLVGKNDHCLADHPKPGNQ